jgi:hypothetical protein
MIIYLAGAIGQILYQRTPPGQAGGIRERGLG